MEISVAEASSKFPGFRFSPTDEELIQYYLKKKLHGSDESFEVIPEVDICRHEPWDLPAQAVIQSDNEWFFFSARGRKYPNGSQSKRATESGYWKATGKERCVKSGADVIGTKRTLVFHTGRAPKGQRTEWIMHEYCTNEKSEDAMVVCRLRKNKEFNLNDHMRRNCRGSSIVNNSTTAFSGGGRRRSSMLEGTNVVDSGSKECISSDNSHTVEQIDTGSESDCKVATNDFAHHESSSFDKCRAEEDDCYADIMKDDIVKLDDDSLGGGLMRMAAMLEPEPEENSSSHPFQGTANRRLRLRRYRVGSPFQMSKSGEEIPVASVLDSSSPRRLKFLITKIKYPAILLFLFILVVLLIRVMFFPREIR
ncbi:hypothetical protein OROHE_012185 [Orobanche hederae]